MGGLASKVDWWRRPDELSTAVHLKTARKRCRGVASASFMSELKVRKAQELKGLFNTFSKHKQKDVFVLVWDRGYNIHKT
jgi:hypothetical protein